MKSVCKLEPIVPVSDPVSQDGWHELLCRRLPTSGRGWRSWYERIPEIAKFCLNQAGVNRLSINIDGGQLLDLRIVRALRRMQGLPITLEWTERSTAAASARELGVVLEHLRQDCGFSIALDDVGIGEDGVGRLCGVRADYVKIDGHVFRQTRGNERIRSLVARSVAFYKEVGAAVVIEHIENESDLQLARRIGADYVQGYLFLPKHADSLSSPVATAWTAGPVYCDQ